MRFSLNFNYLVRTLKEVLLKTKYTKCDTDFANVQNKNNNNNHF